ncbi:predicted phosphohydrolase, MPP superfamily [Lentimicrobium saccharophilum]|uniref:Predicted phosphohydrolase, MPP superfamily n=1 Tax=Lentimicrobium saccharophilum TaxID=1678841 RepID=A0A0S7BXN5_9BACT|nr:metallophosphoesterase [Lentimicrobium saccharophilum]GAP42337.1 predicted phosphohydrolase, MPP superfamily [Lentimicrobium saccharophilum]
MKSYQFLVFFSIVLLIYASVNYYIYARSMQAIPADSSFRGWFRWGFLILASAYVAGRFLERAYLSVMSDLLTWVGAFWLAVMLYGFLMVVLIDLIRLADHFTGFLPQILHTSRGKLNVLYLGMAATAIIVLAGYINAITPKTTKLVLDIPKEANGLKELKIAMASDIHMGTLIGPRRTGKLVDSINALNPDIILLAGDIVDEDLAPVIRQNLGEALTRLKAPLGVYGITGNHEYIGGAEAAVKYLEAHGITMLRDSVVKVADAFYVAGREDRDKNRFSGKPRKEVKELLLGADLSRPVILLDHQPFALDKAMEAGVDLQLSGHTHHGQLWPLNFITRAVYEVSMGYKKKGNTHIYVSPGFGGWGPPVRTGHRPEVVSILLRFR